MKLMRRGSCSAVADRLAELGPQVWRLGGSDAQREVVEETRIAALLRAGRYDEAREVRTGASTAGTVVATRTGWPAARPRAPDSQTATAGPGREARVRRW
jgi:hypothetical protein